MIIRKRHTFRWFHGVVVLLVIALLYMVYYQLSKPLSTTVDDGLKIVVSQTPPPPKEMIYGLPARLMIPKLEINASVKYMGVNDEGDMAVPSNIADVGWYKQGPHPGNKGSAVITGHLIGLKGEPGVFSGLHKLAVGDNFSVVDDRQQSASFVVRKIQRYAPEDSVPEVFNSSDGVHVNLVTCTGVWDKERRQFQERLVIFADAVV